jgi:hypothetical protein
MGEVVGLVVIVLFFVVGLLPPAISIFCDRDIPTTLGGILLSGFVFVGLCGALNWLTDRQMWWAVGVVYVLMPMLHLAIWTGASDTFGKHFLWLLRLGPRPKPRKRKRWR